MIKINENDSRIVVGITHGDINGIGYEVIIKSCLDQRITELLIPIVYGTSKLASYHRKLLNIPDFSFNIIRNVEQAVTKKANLLNLTDNEIKIEIGESSKVAGELSLLSLNAAIGDIKKGVLDVLVTAPINKNNVQQASDKSFTGHTGYLADAFGIEKYLMIMVCENLKVATVTEHIPIESVSSSLNKQLIYNKIEVFHNSLQRDFSIRKPRIAVLGLNPHAGDNGLIGNQEDAVINPAIEQAVKQGWLVYGPYAADGFFAASHYKEFDGVLAMYHDQGLIPFKTLCPENGVNFTAGLPIVRTSPAHGTAYAIAGKDIASPDSFRAAIYLACDIFRNRLLWDEINENPLPFSKKEKEN